MSRRVPGRAVRVAVLPLLALALAAGAVPSSSAAEGSPGVPAATGPGDFETILGQLREEFAESSEAMVRAAADLRLADSALPGARETAAHARRLLVTAQRRQQRATQRRGQAQVRLMLSTQDAEASAAAVEEQRDSLGRLARAAYQAGGTMSEVSMLLEAQSATDFAERLVALQTVVSSQRSALDDLRIEQEAIGARNADLEEIRDELATADKQAQRELRAVASLEASARAAEEQVGRLVATRAAALAAAAAAQADEDAANQYRQLVNDELAAQLAERTRRELGDRAGTDGSTVPGRPGTLGWPVPGRVSSPFGMRVHPITGVYKLHTGTDMSAPCGTSIGASRAGVVTDAGWSSAYGWRTVVSHGVVDGVLLTTTYNHQDSLGTQVGARLAAGQQLGTVGSTGYSTGCHLHFEVYVNSSLVDPQRWLPQG